MGVDIVGWISCPLQGRLGPNGFMWKLKLRSLKAAVEAHLPSIPVEKRASLQVKYGGYGRESRDFTYSEIAQNLDDFEHGIPECANCLLSGGKTLGCYRYITYPVEENFERLLFEFFTSQFQTQGSICNQLYLDVVSHYPSTETSWHIQRGRSANMLAELPEPIVFKWGGMLSQKKIDSAQVLASTFIPLDSTAHVVGYSRYWTEFLTYAQERAPATSRTLSELRSANSLLSVMAALSITGHLGSVLVQA